ncbi:TonB-dependent siderophore receptor [Xylophilus rhododendri]|uniref:TonB-dependent siderophore receptor n=1 Tax=Xylophilus rhododendri TaxID=2697032 RepID=A0A857JBA0_9BURK|nr:TonB-dependent siderophore receptor [Xylophilus rhododendri]QHJ00340.1 TonB-dependent siderophore receptor [Xylophilus rhododendri]
MTASPRFPLRALCLAASAACAPLALHAQATTGQLKEVTVTPTDETHKAINPATSIGSKIALTQREIPQSVSVVSHEQIESQNLLDLQQALRAANGIVTTNVDSSRYRFYARGYEIDTLQVDGVPTLLNYLTPPSLVMYDRVEVLRGPAGLVNGFGSAGGTINLVRKRPTRELQASAEVTLGSLNTRILRADVGGALNAAGTLRGRIVGEALEQDYETRGAHRRTDQLYGVLEADIAPATTASLGFSRQTLSSKSMQYGYPTYTNGSFLNIDREKYYGPDWNHETFQLLTSFAELEHRFDGGWKGKVSLTNALQERYSLFGGLRNAVNPALNTTQYQTSVGTSHDRQTVLDAYASGPFFLLGRRHQLTVGTGYLYEHNRAFGAPGTPRTINVNLTNPVSNIAPITFLESAKSVSTTDTRQASLYGNARFSLTDPLSLIVGARATWWRSEVSPDSVYNANATRFTKDAIDGKLTPYAGLVYDLNDTYSLYGSVTQIFSPQSVRDSSGALIKPLQGRQYEAGVKAALLDGRADASLALFQLTQSNRSVRDPSDTVNTYYLAQGKSRSEGFEAQVSGRIDPRWDVSAGYVRTNTRYFDSSADTGRAAFSAFTPKHLVKLWSQYRLGGVFSGLSLNGSVYATSEFSTNTSGVTVRQGGFATVDVGATYQFTPKLSLALNITNLGDRYYYQSIQTPADHNFLGNPRMAMLTLRAKY